MHTTTGWVGWRQLNFTRLQGRRQVIHQWNKWQRLLHNTLLLLDYMFWSYTTVGVFSAAYFCPVSSSNIYFQRKKELPHLYTCLHPINLALPAQSFNCLERERKASYCWGSELLWHSCKSNFSLQKVLWHAIRHEFSTPVLTTWTLLWSHMFSFSKDWLLS